MTLQMHSEVHSNLFGVEKHALTILGNASSRFAMRHRAIRSTLGSSSSSSTARRYQPRTLVTHAQELQFFQKSALDHLSQVSMAKIVYCVTKKAGLTHAEFFRYWKKTQ